MKISKSFKKLAAIFFVLTFSSLALAQAKHDWPVEITDSKGKIDIYQPQPESLKGNVLTGRAAVAVTVGNQAPVFGAMWFTAKLQTDLDKRTFELLSVQVTKVKFSQASADQEQKFARIVESSVQAHAFKGSLDSLLATIASSEKEEQAAENIKNTPPKILFVKYPAVLVLLDGQPRLQAIDGSKLMRVVNTPMLMVFDPSSKKYYLSSGSVWYSVSDILGAWQIDHHPPSEIANMVTSDAGKPVANNVPDAQMPRIIVSEVPTELISSDGEPQYTPISGTNLLYMSNTESDVFMSINNQNYYVLLAGRWYTNNSLTKGVWNFVAANKLPSDFARIPANSAKANVLASVAKTTQAQEAVAEAQIPQTATIKRDTHFKVSYDGQPQFKKISGTNMQYAVNTSTPVILASGKYYACDSAVWFYAPTPNGPWNVADSIPSEINSLPPDCPIYNVKYVSIYGSTPDVVYVGYTPGYLGFYPYYGTVVYGTGFIYPVYGPIYYPPPITFGFAVHYSYWTNSWIFGYRVSYGFIVIGHGWNTYWGHGWYPGPYIHHPVVYGNNININRNINIGNHINIGNKTINVNKQTRNNIYNNRNNTNRLINQQNQQRFKSAQVDRSKINNVITDKNGNVYRNGKNGWEKNENGKWSKAKEKINQRPAKTVTPAAPRQRTERVAQRPSDREVPKQVLNDYQARESGINRASTLNPGRQQFSRAPLSRSPGGGGFRR
jgi:hypothetical protein